MDITLKTATIMDLKKIQELNFKLFEKEKKEYDPLLDVDWVFEKDGTKYWQDKISKEDCCVLVAIVDGKIVGYLCGELAKNYFSFR